MPLTGAIVARIQLLGNKFLHPGKIAENNRENLLWGVKKVWNTGVINPIQKLITEREALLTATEPLWPFLQDATAELFTGNIAVKGSLGVSVTPGSSNESLL